MRRVHKLGARVTQTLGCLLVAALGAGGSSSPTKGGAVFGGPLNPKFRSNRIDYGAAVLHPVCGNDWSTRQLK